ncbi:mucin-5AC-like isoform X2 [Dreissena polymorpha]|uniref:mucin-5AC-like isoform X2 n=1 Tax=Dreissena polymorpha TaxID=45954 RepID=UPI0022653A2B|nr:mucin-5AC-like isoform X2 [Dreissena polymorpha]
MELIHLSFVALVLSLTCFFATANIPPDDTDACNEARNLQVEGQLLHTQHQQTFTACNTHIDPGWYRPIAYGQPVQIPHVCIKNNACNTQLPLRLDLGDRTLPNVNVTIWASVCTSFDILGQWDCCVLRQRIGIRNCSEFYVYYMEPVDRCPVAYCFHELNRRVLSEYTLKRGEVVPLNNFNAPMTLTPPPPQTTTNQNAATSTTERQNANPQTSATLESSTDDHTVSGETTPSERNEVRNVTSERESNPSTGNEFTASTTERVQGPADSSTKLISDTDGTTHRLNATERGTQYAGGLTSTEATTVTVTLSMTSTPPDVLNRTENATNTGFRCTNQDGQEILVPVQNRCNSNPDCVDHSDEINCENAGMCVEGMPRCPNSTKCYIKCDGVAQCADNSDEHDCLVTTTSTENTTLPALTPVTIFESTNANVTESISHETTAPDNASPSDRYGDVTMEVATQTAITFTTTVTETSSVTEVRFVDVSTNSSVTAETSSSNAATITGASPTSTEHIDMTEIASTVSATTVSVDNNVAMPTENATRRSTMIPTWSSTSANTTENTQSPTGNDTSASTTDNKHVHSENVTSTEFTQFPTETSTFTAIGSTTSIPRPMENTTYITVADSTQIATETSSANEIATPEIGTTTVETTTKSHTIRSDTTSTVPVFETSMSSLPDSTSETTERASETTINVALETPSTTTTREATSSIQEITTKAFTSEVSNSTQTIPLTLSTTRTSSMPTVHTATQVTSKSSSGATHTTQSTDSVQTTGTTAITEIAGKPSDFHENLGLYVFLIVAGIIVFGIVVFGIIGYFCTKRMRRWEPDMAYQDAYADLTEVEKISLSQASTLECSKTDDSPQNPERKQTKKPAISKNDINAKETGKNNASTVCKEETKPAQHEGEDNSAYENDDVIDGVTPVDEYENEFPGELFPWIEQAADTQL